MMLPLPKSRQTTAWDKTGGNSAAATPGSYRPEPRMIDETLSVLSLPCRMPAD